MNAQATYRRTNIRFISNERSTISNTANQSCDCIPHPRKQPLITPCFCHSYVYNQWTSHKKAGARGNHPPVCAGFELLRRTGYHFPSCAGFELLRRTGYHFPSCAGFKINTLRSIRLRLHRSACSSCIRSRGATRPYRRTSSPSRNCECRRTALP